MSPDRNTRGELLIVLFVYVLGRRVVRYAVHVHDTVRAGFIGVIQADFNAVIDDRT